MSEIRIGGRKVIFSNHFLIPDGEEAFFTCNVSESDILNCTIKFEFDEQVSDGSESDAEKKVVRAKLEVEFTDGDFILLFKNFTNSTGISFSKPFIFAQSDKGEEITLMARVHKLKNMMQLNLQVMLEDE